MSDDPKFEMPDLDQLLKAAGANRYYWVWRATNVLLMLIVLLPLPVAVGWTFVHALARTMELSKAMLTWWGQVQVGVGYWAIGLIILAALVLALLGAKAFIGISLRTPKR